MGSIVWSRALRIVSLNLSKRVNNMTVRAALQRWLARANPDILLLQEAARQTAQLPNIIFEMEFVSGDGNVACWSKSQIARPLEKSDIPAILVETKQFNICCTYLSAYSSKTRLKQIENLRNILSNRSKSVILLGDFNLAPMPEDGRYGAEESKWTSVGERNMLQQLLTENCLVDLTSFIRLGEQHYTFERINKGKWTRFRCDLAFAPGGDAFYAQYDHNVRRGSDAFTDHSACIVDIFSNVQTST